MILMFLCCLSVKVEQKLKKDNLIWIFRSMLGWNTYQKEISLELKNTNLFFYLQGWTVAEHSSISSSRLLQHSRMFHSLFLKRLKQRLKPSLWQQGWFPWRWTNKRTHNVDPAREQFGMVQVSKIWPCQMILKILKC